MPDDHSSSSGDPLPGDDDAPRSSADAAGVPESPEAVPPTEAAEDSELGLEERLRAADEAERIEEAHRGEAERSPTRARVPTGPAPSPAAAGTPGEAGRLEGESVPGADLVPDIVAEGEDPLAPAYAAEGVEPDEVELEPEPVEESDEPVAQPLPRAAIDLAAGATYRATGKRKTAVARVLLRPGSGTYTINARPMDEFFPRPALLRTIRQPLETVGYDGRMDVIARLHGGGVSSQAGALRHGISRALIDADPNLRLELKRRGFLTRDPRVKERRKAGLKKARKRPQFSKR